jgi:succinate dehydrogenase / fumarate reductase flavoprotein subunit
MWKNAGMSRNKSGLQKALEQISELRGEFWQNVNIPQSGNHINKNLEQAGRLADFLELSELLAVDALERNESCGSHFREEYQTKEGEAKRDDENYSYVAAWEFKGNDKPAELHKEELVFQDVKLSQRSYK